MSFSKNYRKYLGNHYPEEVKPFEEFSSDIKAGVFMMGDHIKEVSRNKEETEKGS